MATMKVRFVSGIGGDKVEVTVKDGEQVLHNQTYSYGDNASYNRLNAEIAASQYARAQKNGWTSRYYCLKPFIGDIEYSGYYVFANREATPEEVQHLVDKIADEV